jgi:hypothetical protein
MRLGSVAHRRPYRRFALGSLASLARDGFRATLPEMANTSETPWGRASVVDELTLPQRVGDRRFAFVVQLLDVDGERLVRFAYATGGTARRGPVTLRVRDLERVRTRLGKHPELAAALGWEVA